MTMEAQDSSKSFHERFNSFLRQIAMFGLNITQISVFHKSPVSYLYSDLTILPQFSAQ